MRVLHGLTIAAILLLPAATPKPKPEQAAPTDFGYLLDGFLDGCNETPTMSRLWKAIGEVLPKYPDNERILNLDELYGAIAANVGDGGPDMWTQTPFIRQIDCAKEVRIPLEGQYAGLPVAYLSLGFPSECDYVWQAVVFNARLEIVQAKIGSAVAESDRRYKEGGYAGGVFVHSIDGGTRARLECYLGA